MNTSRYRDIPKAIWGHGCESQKGSLLFDTAQYDGIAKKILEFNAAFSSDEVMYSSSKTAF